MTTADSYSNLVALDPAGGLWERFFTVSPLVLIGTVDDDGEPDLAPKHMAFPLGWTDYFGFVCTPRHATYANARRTGGFTVSYPRPADVVTASLTAAPRCEDTKPIVGLLETFAARKVEGPFVSHGYLYFECELDRTVDGLGDNALVVGRIVAAYVDPAALRSDDRDDAALLLETPLLAYLHPGRFATIDSTQAFPFPAGMRR